MVGGGLALLLVAGGGAYFALKPAPPPPSSTVPGSALTEALVSSQVDLARKSLEFRDYKGAIATAEKALKLDPTNAGAQEIRQKAQTVLDELDAAATEARAAVQAGDSDRASRALAKVISIDPNHPVAAELSKQLDSRFKGQAEDARRNMKRAAQEAEKAKASGLAEYADATNRAREAESAFLKSEFTGAAQKFLEARDGYDRARRAALDRATPPPATMAQASPPPSTLPPVTAPPVTNPPVTAPPVTAPPITTPPTTQAVNEEPAVRKVVETYRQALERRDLGLFKSVKPNMSGDEERKLRAAFDNIKSQEVSLSITSVQIDGSTATVRASRRGSVNGQAVPAVQQIFVLSKSGGAWTIREIGQ